jgi:type VI secretion system secreted protein VgrG
LADLEDIELDQSERLVSVEHSPFGPKKLLIAAFECVEQLSTLPRCQLQIMTLGRALKPSEMLGQKLGFALQIRSQSRKYNGIVSSLQVVRSTVRDHFLHLVEVVPPAWILTLNQRCQLFHDKKATDIVAQVLQDGAVASQLKSSGAVREYTVQYCESDFNFISRLLEEEGLFYRFSYADANCPIVTGDAASDFIKMDPYTLDFAADIDRWQPQYQVVASTFKHAAWDFQAVDVIEGNANSLAKAQPPGLPARAFYDYSGRFATADAGKQLAVARMEEQESNVVAISGNCTCVAMQAGAKFKIKNHSVDLPAANSSTDTFVLVRVEHHLHDFGGIPFEGESEYSNDFVCMPADFVFRPPRSTPRPQIRGPQTATVTDGPDSMGRVRVKFPWFPDDQSCWMRVAQSWAYNKMGTQYLPRIDSEVVIEYLDADPDRPIIVGMVYNGKNALPYAVPANKTQSGIRGANWGDAGVADTSNEMRFEDLAGSEEIYLHAQKDFRRIVKNDDTLTVEEGDRTIEIKQGKVSETLDVGDYATKLSQGNRTIELSQGNVTEKLDVGDYATKLSQGNRTIELSQGNLTETLDVGDHATKLTAGNHSVKLSAGASSVEAMQSITLKVGGNSLTIDNTGVTIKGMMVSIQGQVQLDLKGTMTSVNGDGMLTLKGSITMIN